MPQIREIKGIPTKQKANRMAKDIRILKPNWVVEIIGSSAPYTIRSTPPVTESISGSPTRTSTASPTTTATTTLPPSSTPSRTGVLEFLDFIAKYESRGNYNAYFSHASNQDNPSFTSMSIDEVLSWQRGRSFSACGKYQIIFKTLESLKRKLGLNGNEKYNVSMQNKMGIELLKKRNLNKFLSGKITRESFALSVSKEWAALPRVVAPNGEKSYYAGDGLNQAHVSVDEYLTAIDKLRTTT